MKSWKLVAALLCLPMVAGLMAQEERERKQQPGKDEKGMPTFTPSKEHQVLKKFDGDWEFKAKCNAPGMEPMEGTGTETARVTFGGFWLSCEEKGMMKNKDFSGQGFMGWDPQKKKYCGVWVDSMSPFLSRYEGEADSSGKVFTFKFMGTEDHKSGKSAKDAESKEYGKELGKTGKETGKEGMKCPDRMVQEIKDQDHRTLKFYGKDDSGKESLWTEITYTRKPAMIK